ERGPATAPPLPARRAPRPRVGGRCQARAAAVRRGAEYRASRRAVKLRSAGRRACPPPPSSPHGGGGSRTTLPAVAVVPATAGRLARQQLDFVVVVVVADELEQLRRGALQPGDLHLHLPRLLQPGDLAALAVEQVVGHGLL